MVRKSGSLIPNRLLIMALLCDRKPQGRRVSADARRQYEHAPCGVSIYASRMGLINHRQEEAKTLQSIARMNTKVSSVHQAVGALSGGNQQKIVLSKWLEKTPRILLLDEPTRGVDVGAKFEIYNVIRQLAAAGQQLFWCPLNCQKSWHLAIVWW